MIQNFRNISKGAHLCAISHDSHVLVVCKGTEAVVSKHDSEFTFISNTKISNAVILSLSADQKLVYYVILGSKDGYLQVLSDTGQLVFKQFIMENISRLKVNYAQDFIYSLAGNVIVTLKVSFTGSLSICEKINLIGSAIKDVLMLGSDYKCYLSPITINQNGQVLYNKYENVFISVGKMISFYGRMEKRQGSWTMGQLEDSLGYFFGFCLLKVLFFLLQRPCGRQRINL